MQLDGDFSGRQKTLITQESLGVYLVLCCFSFMVLRGALELWNELVHGEDIGRQDRHDLAGASAQTELEQC